jgi:superfamily II DNA or RNA helicase/HKD family nuclease
MNNIISNKNCSLGDSDHLVTRLKEALGRAVRIDLLVAFLMESGVRLIEEDLRKAVEKGIPVRILTGNYLNITEPSALYLLKDVLGDKVDLRFYNETNRSFHPKAYFFEYGDGGDIFLGSSNLSKSALTSGIEWNYRVSKESDREDYEFFRSAFDDLFLNHSIIVDDNELERYSKGWKKPKVHMTAEDRPEAERDSKIMEIIRPRGAQVEALYELRKCRAEGLDKGMVVAATGIGKTYLAAFDSKGFSKVLFVAHREEILSQAMRSFKNVRPEGSFSMFSGSSKEKEGDIVFATVQTLGEQEYLNAEFFKRDAFDYVVIDEFHHAAAGNYQKIIDYFRPKFLLGITATPERLDNKDVFAICDYNVAYEVRLKSAIEKGWLVPFRYYGIYDETDYSAISLRKGKYDEAELESALMINKRADLVLNHYRKYRTERALGFCSSIKHAEFMAGYFKSNGVRACTVNSGIQGANSIDRKEALSKLAKGELNVIFSVDIFNEGVDIPNIDLVMFLRPTESPTVFIQQLGRGLRKAKDKRYLNVLDFIGNYRKANLIPFLLAGSYSEAERTGRGMPKEEEYPEDCIIDFDFRLIDIFKKQAEEQMKIKDMIMAEFFRVQEDLGRRPSRLEFFTYMDGDIYEGMRRQSKYNVFRNYLRFLEEIKELSSAEENLIGTAAESFINMIELTSMTKTYKMPLFMAFCNEGNLKLRISDEDIYRSFRDFYSHGSNSVDLRNQKSTEGFRAWGKKEWVWLAKSNPVHFLAKTHGDFFTIDGDDFCITDKLEPFSNNEAFMANFRDAIQLRTREYYKNRYERRQNVK